MLKELEVVLPNDGLPESLREKVSSSVSHEFPSVLVTIATDRGEPVLLSSSQWRRGVFDDSSFDLKLDELARVPFTLRVADDRGERAFPIEVLNRCQRLIGRRNAHSQGPMFDRILRRHREMHDLSSQRVRIEYDHALDTWQWTLRLNPSAWAGVQIAALFHDVGRVMSGTDRGEYRDFHARAGAEIAWRLLATSGVDAQLCDHVVWLIAGRERIAADPDIALLNDADALSFFSLSSRRYADSFGPEQARKAIAENWNRMRPAAREKLASVRMRDDIRQMLDQMRE
jgi:hypothetical protein